MVEKEELVKSWFCKAEKDLESAKILAENNLFETAVYHCQQSAEKALKSFLIYHDIRFGKTHNILYLL